VFGGVGRYPEIPRGIWKFRRVQEISRGFRRVQESLGGLRRFQKVSSNNRRDPEGLKKPECSIKFGENGKNSEWQPRNAFQVLPGATIGNQTSSAEIDSQKWPDPQAAHGQALTEPT
jgi:hypothetical protein